MKHMINFSADISYDSVCDLINDLEKFKADNCEGVIIILNTLGGSTLAGQMLIDYFNELDDLVVDILVGDFCHSAGFKFIVAVDNPSVNVVINRSTVSTVHLSYLPFVTSLETIENNPDIGRRSGATKCRLMTKIAEQDIEEFYKHIGLDDEQLDILSRGGDVVLTCDGIIKARETYQRYLRYSSTNDENIKYSLDKLDAKIAQLQAKKQEILDTYKEINNKEFGGK